MSQNSSNTSSSTPIQGLVGGLEALSIGRIASGDTSSEAGSSDTMSSARSVTDENEDAPAVDQGREPSSSVLFAGLNAPTQFVQLPPAPAPNPPFPANITWAPKMRTIDLPAEY